MDILDDLLRVCGPGSHNEVSIEQTAVLVELCQRAAAEIRHLRSVARAVTWGAGDYRTIAKVARHDLCGNE